MKVAYLSDIHFPYFSPEAWGMTLDLLGQIKPDKVFLGGDIWDFYQVSSFEKDPMRRFQLQEDIDVGIKELKRLRRILPDADFIFKEGNHELRMQTFLFAKAPELSGLRGIALPELLEFGSLGISKFIRNAEKYKIGHLYYLHGNETRTGGVHPARSIYLKTGVNSVSGHVHRFDHHGDHALGGREHGAWTNGCLCMLTPDYLFAPQWDNGWMLITHAEDGLFGIQQIKYFKHKGSMHTIFNGELHRATKGGKVIPLPRLAA